MPTKTRSVDKNFKAPSVPCKEIENRSKGLDPERRKKLEDIRARELLKEKTQQLRHILIKKLTLKFGRVHEDIITNVTVETVKGTEKITSDTLQNLEKLIKDRIRETQDNTLVNNVERSNTEIISADVPESHTQDEPPRQQTPKLPKGAEWQVIAAYDKLVAEEESRRERDKIRQSKLEFKRTLDEHVHLAQELRKGNNNDEINYAYHVNQDVEKFCKEEAQHQAVIKARNMDLFRIRQEQCEDQQRRRDEEKKKAQEFAKNLVKTAHEKLAIDKEMQEDARRRVREMRMKIEEDNVENKKVLEKLRLQERAEDQRLMAEYAAKLDKEAYERDHAFQERMSHIDKSALQFALEGAGKVALEEQRQREALLMKELQLAEERDIAEAQCKEREKKLRLQKMLQGNQQLIQTREQEKREEMQLRIQLAKQYKEEEERVRAEAQEAGRRRLLEQQTYNDRLRQQIQERDAAKVQRDEMVGFELALNKAKLERALAKEEVVQEVLYGKTASHNPVRSLGPF